MAKENKYKVLKLSDMDGKWDLVVQSKETAIQKDGEVLIKLPVNIQYLKDVPKEHKELFRANKPYLTEKEAIAVVHKWYPDVQD